MIKNLADYFLDEQEFYLDNISYNRITTGQPEEERQLICTTKIEVNLRDDIVKLTLSCKLCFDPESVFELTVAYGAILKFKKEKQGDIEWKELDLAKEFKENGQFVTDHLMRRISLLFAEITSSYGQPPVILPLTVRPKDDL